MLTKEELPVCPVATTVQLIGSKWKLLIIRNLRARPWRFNELRKDLEGIFHVRRDFGVNGSRDDPVRLHFAQAVGQHLLTDALSPLGESMRPILDAMEKWGTEYKNS